MEITTIGLDLAKNVFQIHCIDGSGQVVLRKALRRAQVLPFFARAQPCLVGMEACGTSAPCDRRRRGGGDHATSHAANCARGGPGRG